MKQKTVFIVDDSATNLLTAEQALEKYYKVITLSSVSRMFSMLGKLKPDLILLDIEMPEINGIEAMKLLKENDLYSSIPVIFLTALNDSENEAYGIELGAADFITKPFSVPVLLNRIRYHMDIDELIRERTARLSKLQNSIVFTLADIVESRDKNTGGHIDRMAFYTRILIATMTSMGVYTEETRNWNQDSFISSARLHDIGKVSVPDSILNKPGPLTDEEYLIMKSHCIEGERIIEQMIKRSGDDELLRNAKLSAAYHHERWDGLGYPHRLSGADIPLQGRIIAVVDAYDALTTERPYKSAMPHNKAMDIIKEDAGKHFDQKIVDVFLAANDDIEMTKVILKEGK
ncbi:MAG: response regulator [Treponema sp.]|nr:response regulator [Treponema sp.]